MKKITNSMLMRIVAVGKNLEVYGTFCNFAVGFRPVGGSVLSA